MHQANHHHAIFPVIFTLSGYMGTTTYDLRSFAWVCTTFSIYLILSSFRLERERVFVSDLFGFRQEGSLVGLFSLFVFKAKTI